MTQKEGQDVGAEVDMNKLAGQGLGVLRLIEVVSAAAHSSVCLQHDTQDQASGLAARLQR